MDADAYRLSGAAASLFARYARRADDHDYDAWGELFSPDAVFAFGSDECRGREAIRAWLADRLGGAVCFHSIVNIDVVPDGPMRARADADFVFHRREGAAWEISLVGRYEDVLVLEEGEWRFLEHRIVPR